jgi:hypothetical protein
MENIETKIEIKQDKKSKNNFTAGIHINRLVNKETYKNFDELIKCKICFDILVNPYDCEKCGNTFCHDCGHNLVKDAQPCPFNCTQDEEQSTFKIKPSSLAITSFLSSLKFYCLNKEIGCTEQISYMKVLAHDKECSYSFSKCPNTRCGKLVRRQALETHIRKECEYSLFKCENCSLDFSRNDYIEHVDNCKIIENVFDIKQPILDTGESADMTNAYHLGSFNEIDLKDLSNSNFMRMILFHLGKMNFEIDKKFTYIQTEMKGIREDMNKYQSDNLVFIENINNEIEVINERISHLETGISHNEGVKKMVEENMRETMIIRESVFPIGTFANKPNSKENSISTNNTVTSGNNSKKNSEVLNVFNKIPEKEREVTTTANNHLTKEIPQVKKLDIRNLKMTNKIKDKSPQRSLNKSPVNNHGRSPVKDSFVSHNIHNSGIPFNTSTKTYNIETESHNIRTNNIALIKSMIKNQEVIIDHLNKLVKKVEHSEIEIVNRIEQNENEIKKFLNDDIIEEIKGYTLESSLDNSNRIIKKIEDSTRK